MKLYKVTISFNTHCDDNLIKSQKHKIIKYLKTFFFNTKKFNYEWKEVTNDSRQKNVYRWF